MLTGYYEAELNGASFPGGPYQVPIYAKPRDLVTVSLGRFRADLEGLRIVGRVEDGRLLPYHTRQEIDNGALGMGGAELLWSDDPVDVFFLHIQGSGRVRMPDGSFRRIGFAASPPPTGSASPPSAGPCSLKARCRAARPPCRASAPGCAPTRPRRRK
ncbi:MAG: MltA domain-containing protein [Alphaproteobacteria bacterium]